MTYIIKYVKQYCHDIDVVENNEYSEVYDSFYDLMVAYNRYVKDNDVLWISVFIVKDIEQIL